MTYTKVSVLENMYGARKSHSISRQKSVSTGYPPILSSQKEKMGDEELKKRRRKGKERAIVK